MYFCVCLPCKISKYSSMVVAFLHHSLLCAQNHTPEKCIPLKGASFEGDPATMIMKITTATGEEIEMECPDQFCMDRWVCSSW